MKNNLHKCFKEEIKNVDILNGSFGFGSYIKKC